MEFTFKLTEADAQVILNHLDLGRHGEVREVIDKLQLQAQEQVEPDKENNTEQED